MRPARGTVEVLLQVQENDNRDQDIKENEETLDFHPLALFEIIMIPRIVCELYSASAGTSWAARSAGALPFLSEIVLEEKKGDKFLGLMMIEGVLNHS
jgi:hypothetical protein